MHHIHLLSWPASVVLIEWTCACAVCVKLRASLHAGHVVLRIVACFATLDHAKKHQCRSSQCIMACKKQPAGLTMYNACQMIKASKQANKQAQVQEYTSMTSQAMLQTVSD